jgi:hypothetical protein
MPNGTDEGKPFQYMATLTTQQADTEAEPSLDSSSLAPPSTHPRLTLKLGPPPNQARIVPVEGGALGNPPLPGQPLGPIAEHRPDTQEPGTMPTDAMLRNL